MRPLTTAVVALLLTGMWATTTAVGDTQKSSAQFKPPPPTCTYKAFKPFSKRVWRLDRWARGKPSHAAIAGQRRKLSCASAKQRKFMAEKWRQDKEAFYAHRGDKLAERLYLDAISPPGAATLSAIRMCESGGNYSTETGNGFSGAYQFTQSTWESVGGTGIPSQAPPREQDERAAELYRISGSSPWPVCGV